MKNHIFSAQIPFIVWISKNSPVLLLAVKKCYQILKQHAKKNTPSVHTIIQKLKKKQKKKTLKVKQIAIIFAIWLIALCVCLLPSLCLSKARSHTYTQTHKTLRSKLFCCWNKFNFLIACKSQLEQMYMHVSACIFVICSCNWNSRDQTANNIVLHTTIYLLSMCTYKTWEN